MKKLYILQKAVRRQKWQLFIFLLFWSFSFKVNAQDIEWDKTYGGNLGDNLTTAQKTKDGGYILGGMSASGISGDKSGTPNGIDESMNSGLDYWIVKLNAAGNKVWDKTFGGFNRDELNYVEQTLDGGYILGGSSYSGIGGDKSEANRNESDYWVIKVDADGNKEWDRTLGGMGYEQLQSVQQTADGGFIVGGSSTSRISGDKATASKGAGYNDFWVVKLDASGNKVWDRTFGGNITDTMRALEQTKDGGYVLGGTSDSDASGDKSEGVIGLRDYWMIKIDASGNKEWDQTFGGNSMEELRDLKQTRDGGYILGGESISNASGDKSEASRGNIDYWILKVDANGTKEWDRTIGGTGIDELLTLDQTVDGGYLIGGNSNSSISGEKREASHGGDDFWIVKVNASGSAEWDQVIGGNGEDKLRNLFQTPDGGFFLAGYSASVASGDKTEDSRGSADYWVVKLSSEVSTTPPTSVCHTLNFEQERPGLISSTSTSKGAVSIAARKRNEDGTYASENHAAVFNTLSPTGGDSDLYTSNWGNALIINQNLESEPNDNAWGGEITLDFSAFGPVTMTSLKALDFDVYEDNSWVYLYDGAGNEIHKVKIPSKGNMSQQEINLGNTKGVMRMKVVLDGYNAAGVLAGSGAIDNIRFCVEEASAVDANAGADKLLTCNNTAVTLIGSSTTPGATFRWSGPDGYTANGATPTVTVAGTYTLTVTEPATGATASDEVVVTQSTVSPVIDIISEPGKITCSSPSKRLLATSDVESSTYAWTGPNGFTANTSGIYATVGGRYYLTVTVPATGCKTEMSILVEEYFPEFTVSAGEDKVISCKEKTATLVGSVTGSENTRVIWKTNSDRVIVSGYQAIQVSEPGTYIFQAYENNSGCSVSDTVEVTMDTEAPNISAQGGMFSSDTGTLQLMGSSTTEGVTYSWTGPDGYTSTEQNPVVDAAGDYTLMVTAAANGCTATTTVTVEEQAVTSTESISQVQSYPNPVVDKASIAFRLKQSEAYVVNIYDLKGNLVQELSAGQAKAGQLVQVEFDSQGLNNGVYVARIQSATGAKTVKLILRK